MVDRQMSYRDAISTIALLFTILGTTWVVFQYNFNRISHDIETLKADVIRADGRLAEYMEKQSLRIDILNDRINKITENR